MDDHITRNLYFPRNGEACVVNEKTRNRRPEKKCRFSRLVFFTNLKKKSFFSFALRRFEKNREENFTWSCTLIMFQMMWVERARPGARRARAAHTTCEKETDAHDSCQRACIPIPSLPSTPSPFPAPSLLFSNQVEHIEVTKNAAEKKVIL